MSQTSPNARYDHVFAIVRVDRFQECTVAPEEQITVKQVVWTEKEPQEETSRLNALNKDKNCTYFWQITQLQRRLDEKDHSEHADLLTIPAAAGRH